MTLPSLRIVIVNWNTDDQLRDCLASLIHTTRNFFELSAVVVVDNASEDGSAERLDQIGLPLNQIRNDFNRGFGAGCNQGAAGATEDYILFLNPDTRAFGGSLDAPISFMESSAGNGVGICGIRMVDEDGQTQKTCSPFPSPGEMIASSFGLHILTGGRLGGRFLRDMDYSRSQTVDQVMGAFFLVRRILFEQLEGFDERYFVYFEEVDFAKRALEKGCASYFVAEAELFHRGQGSTAQALGKRLFYSLRSRLLYSFKHFSRRAAFAVVLATLLVEPVFRLLNSALRLSWRGFKGVLEGYALLYRWLLGPKSY